MVSPLSLRRSRRGKQIYNIGDKVEVVRSGGVDIGTITHKVSGKGTGSPGNHSPRWMVSFDEGSQEEISEKGLGRIIGGADSDGSVSNGHLPTATSMAKPPPVSTNNSNSKEATAKVTAAKKPQARKVRYEPPQENKRVLTRAVRKQNGSATLHSGIEVARKKAPKGNNKVDRSKTSADETVITVKLLTGTLYMYRGAHPRAEFVRSV